ncbi:SCAN domain-containing protein 3 [Nosema granulosis]|uniref:SCAN domain-containing protein 3 n=1 Tax=Nosema granulosis TaxID=83296 RepID=A0A9P6KZH8_9MICR|nr:SCAN domain-containing protein 3 [Nosema granulosis]
MEIEHFKGKDNPTDCLSRLGVAKVALEEKEEENQYDMITKLHERLAHGSLKTLEYHLRDKKMKNKRKQIEEVIKDCLTCQRSGIKYRRKEIIAMKVREKNELWEIDLVGPLPRNRDGYMYLLTSADHFSKIADVCALRSKEAYEVTSALRDTFRRRGIPKRILSDNGREFTNGKIQELA